MTVLWGEDLTSHQLTGAAVEYRPGADPDPTAVLQRCESAGAEALVVVSSARVYGASPGNDMQLDERAEPADSFDDPDLGVLAEADRVLAASASTPRARSGMRVVVVRPVHVMGDPSASASALARALASGSLRTNVGFDPIIQVIHRDDVGSAVDAALSHGLHGVYNVCGPGALPLSVLAREAGAIRVGGIGGVVADLADRVGLGGPARIPPSELRYPINVSDRAFRTAARWEPTLSLSDTVAPSERAPS